MANLGKLGKWRRSTLSCDSTNVSIFEIASNLFKRYSSTSKQVALTISTFFSPAVTLYLIHTRYGRDTCARLFVWLEQDTRHTALVVILLRI
jgi:hypothetical protein